ncbi:MAG TPA: NAD(P)-dependent oxidoreductase [Pyrinomonadaceae bacterium]|jgi:nucleoside-diphosphate-sugar epimerase
MKRVLVTGATGFIGRYALPALLARGYEVHAVARRAQADAAAGDVRWHAADLLDQAQATRLLAEVTPTHLLHLAWYAVPGKYWTATENLAWVCASLNLLTAFAAHGGRRVVLAGTCAEYDWTGDGLCDEARTPLRPATLYGTCKDALRQMLEAYARQSGLSAAWGRIFFLYGPHEYPQRLVAAVIRGLLRRERVPCSQGTQVRDFLYVQDVAEAFVALLESDVSGAVNIAAGAGTTLREVIKRIADQLDGHELVQLGALPMASGEPPRLVATVARLRDEVGWQPRFALDDGLAETIAWWRAQV